MLSQVLLVGIFDFNVVAKAATVAIRARPAMADNPTRSVHTRRHDSIGVEHDRSADRALGRNNPTVWTSHTLRAMIADKRTTVTRSFAKCSIL